MNERAREIVCAIELKIHEYDYNGASDIIAAALDAEYWRGCEDEYDRWKAMLSDVVENFNRQRGRKS